tara:strand:- start:270 stop:827 length:558 start_codon:yes stop_codon:yes gene_type:complete
MKHKVICGIDYSLRSPAICCHIGDKWDYTNCVFHYLTDKKKYTDTFLSRYFGKSFDDYTTQEERYDSISDWATEICTGSNYVGIENYAYNATGRVFNIAENTGILKYKLYQLGIPIEQINPSHVKKIAYGKGNATKPMMYDAFYTETKIDLISEMNMISLNNPITDIVDSYYICKILFDIVKEKQ